MHGGSDDTHGIELGPPPSTTPPPSVRAAILARVVQQTVGGKETPLLDGRYRLLEEIGRGGVGTVWKAELLPLGRPVAVKLLRSTIASDRKAVSRLVREAMTVSKLRHEHIVQVDDVGMDEHGSAYIAMELLQGDSLAQRLEQHGPLPWAAVAAIATQVCDALAAAHAVGVVHRDIKPANVFALRERDGSWRCKLLDFGLCTGGQGEHLPLTVAGVQLGTPGYAAPEQLRGEPVDGRADLYGLACVMVELLTGRPAFEGTDGQARIANQLAGRRAYALDRAGLHPDVVTLLERGLSLDPQLRHDDPEAFARAVAQVARAPEPSPPPRAVLWVAGFVGLALTSAAAVALWPASPPSTLDASLTANVVIPEAPTPRPAAVVPEPPPTATPEPPVEAPVAKRPKRRRRTAKPSAPEPEAPAPVRSYPKGIRDPFAVD